MRYESTYFLPKCQALGTFHCPYPMGDGEFPSIHPKRLPVGLSGMSTLASSYFISSPPCRSSQIARPAGPSGHGESRSGRFLRMRDQMSFLHLVWLYSNNAGPNVQHGFWSFRNLCPCHINYKLCNLLGYLLGF